MKIDFHNRQFAHCESGVTANLLNHHGFPCSEAMAFGIGGGLFFAYVPFIKITHLPRTTFLIAPGNIFKKATKRLGIEVDVRLVDTAQFQQRRQTYDFDMMPFRWNGTLSPGNEQAYRWGSREADIDGTFNVAGAKDPAIDAMIREIVAARSRGDLVATAQALDRLLLSGFYAVPLYHQETDQIAWWGELQHPRTTPLQGWSYGFGLSNWWMSGTN